jgi:EAL domain-containing protein (putative c-di-GMP-specific phosphodiesterase class I)
MTEHRALKSILEPGGITPVYQPVWLVSATSRKLAGFECLSRGPKGTNFEAAKVLFEYVRLKREETLVDRACITAALMEAPHHPEVRLSVNVHASTLGRDEEFVDFLTDLADRSGTPCSLLTVEIVEHAPPWDIRGFADALAGLRARGIHVALDDVGLGQSNFKMILDVQPEYLKLDQYFVDSCDQDANRRAVIDALVRLASHFDAGVVAEGVERIQERDALLNSGVNLMQGFLYAHPLSADEASRLVRGDDPAALARSVV